MSGVPGKASDDDLVFKALASATRRRILDLLRERVRTTGDLCAEFPDLDRTTVLQHLRVLERAELVTGRKVGRERHLALAPLPIKRIHDRWLGEYTRAAVDLLESLRSGERGGVRRAPPDG
jgi:DNA-binding transcriptional ArsR family regulator